MSVSPIHPPAGGGAEAAVGVGGGMTRTTIVGSVGTLEVRIRGIGIWRAIQMNELHIRRPVLFVG